MTIYVYDFTRGHPHTFDLDIVAATTRPVLGGEMYAGAAAATVRLAPSGYRMSAFDAGVLVARRFGRALEKLADS